MISPSHEERITYEGMFFRPNTTIDQVSHLDVLVIPSGAGSLTDDPKDERTLAWIKKIAKTAKYVKSHCEGAFVLGAAGLLDGRDATTFLRPARAPEALSVVQGQDGPAGTMKAK